MERIKNVGALVCLLLFVFANQAFAQSRTAAEVRGTVLDQQGAAVTGATVTITNVLTGVSQKFTTNSDGLYDAPSVPPGKYTISFEKVGFARFERSGIDLDLETITINATLQVGSIHESITVTGEASMVETDTPQGSTTVTSKAIADTPNVGHSWITLLELMPGVSGGGSGQGTGGWYASVNGEGNLQNEWQVDGAHSMLTDGDQPSVPAPLDSIEEVKMLTSNFGAEYGNGLAVVDVVTKSGTNNWHGSLFEYVQNDKLNALNYFATTRTPYHWNEFGGTLGGPILHNKAFFYFAVQANPVISSYPAFSNTPTGAMRSGDFSDPSLPTIYDPATLSCNTANPPVCTEQPFPGNTIPANRIDPVAGNILTYFPQANHASQIPGSTEGTHNYFWTASNPSHNDNYNLKIDYNINSGNRLTAALMLNPNGYTAPFFPCAIDCGIWKETAQQAQLTDVWTFSPHLVGEFRFLMNHAQGTTTPITQGKGIPAQLGLLNPAGNVFPNISVDGVSGESVGPIWPLATDAESTGVVSGKVTWVKGKHILKFGGEFDRWYDNIGWPMSQEGAFDFSGTFSRNPANPNSTGLGWADFLLGLPDSWGVGFGPETAGRMWTGAAFAQDEYKIRPNLTLTLGVRYSIQTGWREAQDRLADFDPTLYNPGSQSLGAIWYAPQGGRHALQNTIWNNFNPRVGFAWVPLRNWSVRGGYGIYNEAWGGLNYFGNRALGWGVTGFEQSTDMMTPIFTLSPGEITGLPQGPPVPTILSAGTRTPDALNGQGVTYYLRKTPIAYVEQYRFDVQHEVKGDILIDVAYVGNSGHHYANARDMNQVPEALLAAPNCVTNEQICRPYPQYASISAFKNNDFSNYNGLQVSFRKEFASGVTFLTNYTWSKAMDTMTVSGTQASPSVWQNAYDVRADYGPASGDQRQMLNGNVVYALPFGQGKRFLNQGGLLNAVAGGWELGALYQFHTGIPFTLVWGGGPNLSGALSGTWRPNRIGSGKLSHPTIQKWFDDSAFVQPAPYTFGNSGRNILYGPGWKDMDLSLLKNFKIREKVNFQVKLETYDAFNWKNWGMPDPGIGDGTTGVITSANTSRGVQLGADLTF